MRAAMSLRWIVCLPVLLGVTPLAGLGQAPQSGQKETPKTASIEGIVVNELTRAPIRRAEVSLILRKRGAQMGPGRSSAITDEEGKFRAGDLEEGAYIVMIRRNGFVPLMGAAAGSPTTVELTAGQQLKGLRYMLKPQAVISGRVLDDEGEPVQNANVIYLTQRRMRGRKMWLPGGQNAQTNDRGEFRLTGVAGGKYLVMVQMWQGPAATSGAPGQPRMGYVTSYYPGVTEIGQAVAVEATAGAETSGLDIPLKRVPVFSVKGKILGADGKPARQVMTLVLPREGGAFTVAGRMTNRGDDGTFEISDVPNGNWVLQCSVGRMGPVSNDEQQFGMAEIEVNGRDLTGLEVRLQPPLVVKGSVVVEAAPNLVKGEVPVFNVAATPDGLVNRGGMMPARTEQDGSFNLKLGAPGKYQFNAYASTPTSLYLASVRVGAEEYYGRAVELGGGAAPTVKIVLRGDGGTVTGSVERREGTQDEEASMVILLPAEPELRNGMIGRAIRSTDQNGAFTFDNLRPGDYLLAAASGVEYNDMEGSDEAKDFDSKAVKVHVTAGGSSRVQLKPMELAGH